MYAMKQQYAQYLIKKTKDDYDTIAGEFDRTRAYCWEGLEQFARYAHAGDRVLDFGCGNGRLFSLFREKSVSYVGADQSCALIDVARKKYAAEERKGMAEFVCLVNGALPFPDASFDCIFSIAALHHIPSKELRERLLQEFERVLKPNGCVVITVWNLWQKKYRALIMRHTLKKLMGILPLDLFDVFIPWKTGKQETMAERYYHCFTIRELLVLLKSAGFHIAESGYFGGKTKRFNMYAVATKEYNKEKNNHGIPTKAIH